MVLKKQEKVTIIGYNYGDILWYLNKYVEEQEVGN